MAFFKRIFLFMLVNILVVATLSIVMSLFNVGHYLTAYGLDYTSLAIFCLVYGMAGAFISLGLSRIMAKMMMRVRVIDPQGAHGPEQDLVAMVHGLARNAGLPAMPEVGIYDSPEVNAFATGPTKSRALVAVSTGLLHRMDRQQVEGVLGHEVAHIANGDMVTMTLLQGIVNAFVMFFARVIAFALSQNAREENRFMIRMVVTMVLEIALGFLGMIVVAYFSRLREFKADRGGASYAGRDKMIRALQGLQRTVELADNDSSALATLKISTKGGMMRLFSTHPPLEERIERLQTLTR